MQNWNKGKYSKQIKRKENKKGKFLNMNINKTSSHSVIKSVKLRNKKKKMFFCVEEDTSTPEHITHIYIHTYIHT